MNIKNIVLSWAATLALTTESEASLVHMDKVAEPTREQIFDIVSQYPETGLHFWESLTPNSQNTQSAQANDLFIFDANSSISWALKTNGVPHLVANRIIQEVWDNQALDEESLERILAPEIIWWDARTPNGQMFIDKVDTAFLNWINLDQATILLEWALRLWHQGTDPESCITVENQLVQSSGKFAKSLGIRDLLSWNNRAHISEAMCESQVSGTLEEVVLELWYEMSEDTLIYNLFGSGDNPEGTDGWVGMPYRIAKQLNVLNAFVTDSGELVVNFEACGGNFWIVTFDTEFISEQGQSWNNTSWVNTGWIRSTWIGTGSNNWRRTSWQGGWISGLFWWISGSTANANSTANTNPIIIVDTNTGPSDLTNDEVVDTPSPVPLPQSLSLLALGILSLGALRNRKKRK